jgi:hypothetical protein
VHIHNIDTCNDITQTSDMRKETSVRKLIISIFVSLDGVMQAPGGPTEDPTEGFRLGGWTFSLWDEVMGQYFPI